MEQNLFRKKNIDKITSPEQLNDYLRVTSPAVWVILLAAALLLAGFLFWCSVTSVESYAVGSAEVSKGVMTITFADEEVAEQVEAGMEVRIGDAVTPVLSAGEDEKGRRIAMAELNVPDGRYDVRVGYKKTQVVELLFD